MSDRQPQAPSTTRVENLRTRIDLRKLRRSANFDDPLVGIAPIYKVSLAGQATLIGTGFWVTEHGHLITAWHVIEDNISYDGVDVGPIYALQTLGRRDTTHREAVPRVLVQSDKHPTADLALCRTAPCCDDAGPTSPLQMTIDAPSVGAAVFTHAVLSISQEFESEKNPGLTTARFRGTLAIPEIQTVFDLEFAVRLGRGHVTQIFETRRDSAMLPFPCFESDMPIYGANSGGPVFDAKGRVCGVNCSSISGSASFHIPLKEALQLRASDLSLVPEDPIPRQRSIGELALARRVLFDPPPERSFSFRERLILRAYHWVLDLQAWIRWHMRSGSN